MTISSQIRAAVKATDATLYRIAKDADIDWGTLKRFVDGTPERPHRHGRQVVRVVCVGTAAEDEAVEEEEAMMGVGPPFASQD